ncbi:NAD(+) diphosphatase [Pseudohoeflea coraliihabitans]|uniref:NAD(+) diphosphatase n=1 Tax=Pseudohoeflea coraliihabitans TaxID=2860393 RepID=A0ABS6WPC5_9HYPH|nr:NAD(+) diphosphatase [Pseudohoeflea sp. DP4N28-3]MBW3097765.1 NAD(+) diphosphatase [Pseudohoeflea sp. DP4N28-3]
MPASIFDTAAPHGEASRLVAFAGNRLDRQSEHRSETDLPDALAEEATRCFAISGGRLVMRLEAERPVGELSLAEIDAFEPDLGEAILLGRDEQGTARVAVPLNIAPEALPENYKAIDGRSVYKQQLLDQPMLGAYAQASSLLAWAGSTRFCGRCAEPMTAEAGGYRRRCGACGGLAFPRTDPVVIMMVIDTASEQCLLGRSPHFAAGMYSCLAGFVEPGETIEDAVRRETFEESGIRVGKVRYHASQPWPMPHTLMIGVFAEALSREIVADTAELEDCRWFDRADTAAMLSTSLGEAAETPPPGAIAHRLMRDWLDWPRE